MNDILDRAPGEDLIPISANFVLGYLRYPISIHNQEGIQHI